MYKKLNWILIIGVFFLFFIYKGIDHYVYSFIHGESKEAKLERLSINNKTLKKALDTKEKVMRIEKKITKLELNLTIEENNNRKKLEKKIETIRTIKSAIVIKNIEHNKDKSLITKRYRTVPIEHNTAKKIIDTNNCIENTDKYREVGVKTMIILNNVYKTIEKLK